MKVKKRNLKQHFNLYLRGLFMGIADIIPGVSGGTIALITGVYEELIASIDGIDLTKLKLLFKGSFKTFWTEINGGFLLFLALGIGTSILLFSSFVSYLLEYYPILIWSFFLGLIVSSVFMLVKQLGKFKYHYLFLITLGFFLSYYITTITPVSGPISLGYLFMSSAIAIIAMILPGISGSFIYILLGAYQEVIHTIKSIVPTLFHFQWSTFRELAYKLIVISLGIIVGLKVFSKILKWLFKNKPKTTLLVLIGFMMGSLPKIWPWQKTVLTKFIEPDKEIILKTEPINPLYFSGEAYLIEAILLFVFGFLLLYFIEKKFAKH